MNFKERAIYVLPISIITIAIDQWTKYLAVVNLKGMPEIPFLGGFFRLMFVTNRGAWGSLGSDWPEPARLAALIVIPVIFILLLGTYMFWPKVKIRKFELIAFSFILAGGVGNMIDRIHAGAVIDMLWMGFAQYRYLQTNVFNIADVAIMIGFFIVATEWVVTSVKSILRK